jgi:hypothetical protein
MSRYLKILGLALGVVLTMSAIMASGAAATKGFKFPESTGTTYLTGEQHAGDDVLTTDGGEVTCSGATYSGSATGTPAASVTLEPAYTGCHLIFIFTFNVTIDTNGCAYEFTVQGGVNANNEGEVDIECPGGKAIEVTAPGCTITIAPQTGLRTITYTNKGNASPAKEMDITADLSITGITYEEHNVAPNNTCASSTSHTTNGTYVGAATVRDYSSKVTHNSTTQTSVTVETVPDKGFKFPESTGTTYLTGEQHAGDDVLTTDGGEVTCSGATYSGSATGTPAASVTLEPAYTGCHLIFIFTFNVTIDTNGCAYEFTVQGGVNANNEGEVDIECPGGKAIEVTAPGCTITIAPQTGLRTITYTNKGNASPAKEMDITADLSITGITYEEHNVAPNNTCASSTSHTTNGTYVGAATVRDYSSKVTHNSTTQTSVTVE